MTLSSTQLQTLRLVAGLMVPASSGYGVPGADDPAIVADMEATLGRDAAAVAAALDALSLRAGGVFAALNPEARMDVALALRAEGGAAMATLARVVLQCYYRDARVVRSLGSEAGAPFPRGHVLEQGDWSLLEEVKGRAPGWRAPS